MIRLQDDISAENILAWIDEMIIIIDADNAVTYVNPAFCSFLGYRADSIIGKDIVLLNSDLADVAQNARSTISPVSRELTLFCCPDEEKRRKKLLVKIEAILIDSPETEPKRLVFVAQDITELSQLRKQLFDFQSMSTAFKLIKGVVHELNRELTLIYAMLDAVSSNIEVLDIKELLNSASSACLRAANTTKNLQSLGSIRQPSRVQSTLAFKCINEVVSGYGTFIFQGLEISIQCNDRSIKVDIDQQKLQQVILNLLINAKEALAKIKNPRIIISITLTKLASQYIGHSKTKYVIISLEDNGCGVEERFLEKIFHPDFTTKSCSDRGMGLHICSEIIKSQGGWIDVESLPHYGSKFSIYLPAVDTVSTQEVERLHKAPDGTETLLYFEENVNLQKRIQTLLEKSGYVVIPVNLLEHLPDACQEYRGKFDVIVFSLWSDEITYSAELDNIIKKYPDIKVIVLTDIITENIAATFGEYILENPYSGSQLMLLIRKLLDKK